MRTSILIPAHDEADWLPDCLRAVIASDPVKGGAEVVVIANGCTDDTAEIARTFMRDVDTPGWKMNVIELPEGGKLAALNAGEAAALGDVLIYLDADVRVSAALVSQLSDVLSTDAPRYASGRPVVTVGKDRLTRAYTRFWETTPFMVSGVPGFGVFAMNRAGRARWGSWPDIISDDTFARLHFDDSEKLSVPANYEWPMIEGFSQLVRVRRRQNAGVAEVAERFPHLAANRGRPTGALPIWRRALRDPTAFAAYCAVRFAVHLPVARSPDRWARGR